MAGATPQVSRYSDPVRWSPDVEPQARMFHSPDIYGYLTVDGTLSHNFNAGINAGFIGPMLVQHYAGFIPSDTETLTPSFLDLAAKVSYHFHLGSYTRVDCSLTVKNILDSYQEDVDLGPDKDSAYIYGPNLPRSVYAIVKLSF